MTVEAPWGWGCVAVGVPVDEHWRCPGCGYKPKKDARHASQRPDGQLVCAACAKALWGESVTPSSNPAMVSIERRGSKFEITCLIHSYVGHNTTEAYAEERVALHLAEAHS